MQDLRSPVGIKIIAFPNMVLHCNGALVTLATADLAKLTRFYGDLFGVQPEVSLGGVYAEFQLPGLRLGIFRPRSHDGGEFVPGSGAMSLCLQVDNLEDAIAHFQDLGYPPPGDLIVASHGREIYVFDPDGNRIILSEK
jgi:catechol 2,3-dioxygenase-like lactoylglutathione lyase family enzyme